MQNNANDPEAFAAIAALSTTENLPFEQETESDIRHNLKKQLADRLGLERIAGDEVTLKPELV